MAEPEMWWSPTHGVITYDAPDEYEPDGVWWRDAGGKVSLRRDGLPNALPADAVRLVPATEIPAELEQLVVDLNNSVPAKVGSSVYVGIEHIYNHIRARAAELRGGDHG